MADEPDTPDADEQVGEPTKAGLEDRQDGTDGDEIEEEDGQSTDQTDGRRRWRARWRLSCGGSALVSGVVVVVALAGLAGWQGYRAYEKHEVQARRDVFIQTARQGAVNLTTINYTEVDADVQRILDLATGAFRDDFEQRSKPFIDVVKTVQSKSEGTVTDAGLESQRGDLAQVLVAVAVKSWTAGGEEAPREWRMRIEVRAVGDDAKVSNVVFVP